MTSRGVRPYKSSVVVSPAATVRQLTSPHTLPRYEVVGIVLFVTNSAMLAMLLLPVAPQLRDELREIVFSLRQVGKKPEHKHTGG